MAKIAKTGDRKKAMDTTKSTDCPKCSKPTRIVKRVKDRERPEAWIAVEEEFIREAHRTAGLRIEEIRYGAWPGRDTPGVGFGKKDAVLAVKG